MQYNITVLQDEGTPHTERARRVRGEAQGTGHGHDESELHCLKFKTSVAIGRKCIVHGDRKGRFP